MNKEITISLADYNRLMINDAIFEKLECNGVDNWQGYGCMCYEMGEDECIFCTEDVLGFLGLEGDKNE